MVTDVSTTELTGDAAWAVILQASERWCGTATSASASCRRSIDLLRLSVRICTDWNRSKAADLGEVEAVFGILRAPAGVPVGLVNELLALAVEFGPEVSKADGPCAYARWLAEIASRFADLIRQDETSAAV